jgi:aryl-alcohol dehydrogenase-like predicted oxidoreductase
MSAKPAEDDIPRRPLGRTGVDVSILCLGGYHLGSFSRDKDATRLVHAALDAGLDFFDNAWEYHEGRSEALLGKALVGRRDQAFVMTKVCTHGRDKGVAMEQLEESLRRLQTDYLDLWQIHECIYPDEPARHFAPDGAVEALTLAKQQGKVRFVGFTGHKDPLIHLDMLSREYPFDTCQLPLNCFDSHYRSFEKQVLPELARQKIAPLGMKSMGGDGQLVKEGGVLPEDALRYVLSLPIASLVSGIDSLETLEKNLAVARGFQPLSDGEMAELRQRHASNAKGGQLEQYKTTRQYDGLPGQRQQGLIP